MSVVGVDIGNANFLVANVKRGGVDVVLNENSQRVNPCLVSFGGAERYLGDQASTQVRMNFKNTVTDIKRLIGRKRSDPAVEHEVQNFLNYEITADNNDEVLIKVNYNEEEKHFTPQQIYAMLLQKVKEIIADSAANDAKASGVAKDNESAKNAGISVANNMDLVLAVPAYYTNRMRQALLDACKIAKVNCLRLIHESTAVALSYGIFKSAKREFSDEEDTKVMFIDAGHSTLTASVVSFRNGALKVLSTACDPYCGSRDIDQALGKHFADEFRQKTGLDAWNKTKARIKFLYQAERTKKTLSPYGVDKAPVNIECVMEDQDYFTTMDIETFEKLAQPVADRVPPVIQRALKIAGVTAKDLANVEVVGGGSRPRIIKRRMAEALGMKIDDKEGHELSTTLNQDEAVSRGTGLQCAILSPKFRVKPFDIEDSISYPIKVWWDADPNDPQESDNSLVLFKPGEGFPATRRVTFKRWGKFTVSASYLKETYEKQGLDFPEGQPTDIAKFEIDGVQKPADADENTQPPKIRVDFRVDLSGCLQLVKAEYLQEVTETPAPSPSPQAQEENADKAMKGSEEGAEKNTEGQQQEEQQQQQQGAEEKTKNQEEGDQEMGGEKSEDQKTEKEQDNDTANKEGKEKKKKRVKRHEIGFKTIKLDGEGGLEDKTLETAINDELVMYERDREIRATQDMRNDLETYIYGMRSALQDKYAEYASTEENQQLQGSLDKTENWLYEGGFDASKEQYQNQLNELRKVGDPIEKRKWEEENRDAEVNNLLTVIEQYKSVLSSTDAKYEHLSDSDRDTLRAATKEVEEWLRTKQDEQGQKARHHDPAFTIKEMREKLDRLHKECAPIKNKPKPNPPKPKESEEKKDKQGQDDNKDNKADNDVNMDGESASPAEQNGEGSQGDDAKQETNNAGENDAEMEGNQ